jgi:hypothetical protein
MYSGLRRPLVVELALTVATLAPGELAAHNQAMYASDGWEAFPNVSYQGGDATQPKRRFGMLVLTDSTIALHECANISCFDNSKGKLPFKAQPWFSIALSSLTQIAHSSQVRKDGAATFFLGALADGDSEGFVGFVYQTARNVEAPLFKMKKEQSGVLDAKVRFRLKRLGIELPAARP